MNLGFDLDEVIAQMAQRALDHLNEVFECEYSFNALRSFQFNCNTFSEVPEEQDAAIDCLMWAIEDHYSIINVKPYEDAVKSLRMFKKQGHKIIIVTKRPKNLKDVTHDWMHKNNVPYDKLILTDHAPKSSVIGNLKLDCFVDDLESNLIDLYKAQSRWKKGLLLMTRPWNENNPIDVYKFTRVNNWVDIKNKLSIGNRLNKGVV